MPARLTATVGGSLDDLGSALDQLVLGIDGDRHIRRAVRQFYLPGPCATGFIARGKHGFHNGVFSQRQSCTDGITAAVSGTNDVVGAGGLMGGSKGCTGKCVTIRIGLVDLDVTFRLNIIEVQMVEAYRIRGLTAGGCGHPLYDGDLRASVVTDMDHKVLNPIIVATATVQIVSTSVDGYVS